jgi:hypothetical protein
MGMFTLPVTNAPPMSGRDAAKMMVNFRPIQSGSHQTERAPKGAPAEKRAFIAPRIEAVYEAFGPSSSRLKYV